MYWSFGFIYVEIEQRLPIQAIVLTMCFFFSGRYLSSLQGQANLPSLLIMALAFCTWTYIFFLARSRPLFSSIEWPMSSRKQFAIWSFIPRRNAYCLSVYATLYIPST